MQDGKQEQTSRYIKQKHQELARNLDPVLIRGLNVSI